MHLEAARVGGQKTTRRCECERSKSAEREGRLITATAAAVTRGL